MLVASETKTPFLFFQEMGFKISLQSLPPAKGIGERISDGMILKREVSVNAKMPGKGGMPASRRPEKYFSYFHVFLDRILMMVYDV